MKLTIKSKMKLIIKRIIMFIAAICCIFCIYVGYVIYTYGTAIRKEINQQFEKQMQYIKETSLQGVIIDKYAYDHKEERHKYYIVIKCNEIGKKPIFYSYGGAYRFDNDSICNFNVPKSIFNKVEVGTSIFKEANSFYINIDSVKILFVNSENQWFPLVNESN